MAKNDKIAIAPADIVEELRDIRAVMNAVLEELRAARLARTAPHAPKEHTHDPLEDENGRPYRYDQARPAWSDR